MDQYNITTLEPLVQNPHLEMWPNEFETENLPLEDNILMAKISSSVVYKKYVRATHPSETFKNKFESTITQNHFLTAKVKALEMEKQNQHNKLVFLGKDSQETTKLSPSFKEINVRIKDLESSQATSVFLLT